MPVFAMPNGSHGGRRTTSRNKFWPGGGPSSRVPPAARPFPAQRLVSEARSRLRGGEIDSLAFSLALQRLQTLQNPPARSESGASSTSRDLPSAAFDLRQALQAAEQRRDTVEGLRLAADRGDATAQARLGRMHMFGDDVPLDVVEAVRRSRQAAEQGNPDAQNLLGYAYSIGRGVERNDDEAVRWLQRAAEQGNADAQYRLGRMYEYMLPDAAEAVRWLRRAAEQGHRDARERLDVAYSNWVAHTVSEDEPEEVRRLRAAAEAGDAEAQAQLGLAYTPGNGVDKHEGEAERWFRRAAEHGHADAQFGLAGVYLNGGRGVRPSSVLAHMWFSIAVANGTSQATMAGLLRGLAEREMTSAEVNQAIQLARECTASSFQSCEP